MTLLTIARAVADEVDILQPATVFGNPNPDSQKFIRYANKTGKELLRRYDWQQLRKEQTFTSLAQEEQTGILPSDFDRICVETFWDRSEKRILTGPITPQEYQGLKVHGVATQYPRFMLRGSSAFILPVPAAGNALAFEYVSKNWALSSDGSPQSTFLADTDTVLLNEELFVAAMAFFWLDGEGQPSGVAAGHFERILRDLIKQSEPRRRIMTAGDIFGGGRHYNGVPPTSGAAGLF